MAVLKVEILGLRVSKCQLEVCSGSYLDFLRLQVLGIPPTLVDFQSFWFNLNLSSCSAGMSSSSDGAPECPCGAKLSRLSDRMLRVWEDCEGECWFRLSEKQAYFRFCVRCHSELWPRDLRTQGRWCRPGAAYWAGWARPSGGTAKPAQPTQPAQPARPAQPGQPPRPVSQPGQPS